MSPHGDRKSKLAYGDFQTPYSLALDTLDTVRKQGFVPRSVLEPTCGTGTFLKAAVATFPHLEKAYGLDINPDYLRQAASSAAITCELADCFETDWRERIAGLPRPLLIAGNPPWVTSSRLGVLGFANAPKRDPAAVTSGLAAITGKSNFDVSEWLLLRWIEAMRGIDARLIMLVKTSVARRILARLADEGGNLGGIITTIDARQAFGAGVSACMLEVFEGAPKPQTHNGLLILKEDQFAKWRHLAASTPWPWRSGIKHDAGRIMELAPLGGGKYRNGLGEVVELEDQFLFPLLKAGALTGVAAVDPDQVLVVPQRSPGCTTDLVRESAPLTWRYLESHAGALDGRSSSIYRKAPRFGIFGVGDYSFAPWKVATSCLHKQLRFSVRGPYLGKPVVFGDTCAMLGFDTERQARAAHCFLESEPAREFLDSLIAWDAKRPITIEILRALGQPPTGNEGQP